MADLRTHVTERLASVPALSATIVGSGTAVRWEQSAPVVTDRLRVRRLPLGGSVKDAVRDLDDDPFPPDGPQWDMTLLHGHEPDRYALVYRVNHGVQDMGGVVYALEALFSAQPVPAAHSSGVVRALGDFRRAAPLDVAAAAVGLARLSARADWPMPEHPCSGRRAFHWASVPTGLLRSASRPYGGSANDAYIASLTRAVAAWAAEHAPRIAPDGLPLMVAVNLRRPAEADALGNYVFGARLAGPGREVSVEGSLRAAVRATARIKTASGREAIRRLQRAMPRRFLHNAMRSVRTTRTGGVLCSSHVLRHPLQFRGDPVHAVDSLTTLPAGAPASVLLLTYRGRSSAHFVTDPALPGMEALHRQWEEAVHLQARSAV
ncbi:hypothetical protein ACIGXM_09430 [Kitasatospora sp. NPDC052896]|uniref:hypothetical protein n=1 Tax=Kitasatospora sp. NPDC052896 TaxID=3364061 RepID=UPI0037CA3DAA